MTEPDSTDIISTTHTPKKDVRQCVYQLSRTLHWARQLIENCESVMGSIKKMINSRCTQGDLAKMSDEILIIMPVAEQLSRQATVCERHCHNMEEKLCVGEK